MSVLPEEIVPLATTLKDEDLESSSTLITLRQYGSHGF